MNLQKRNNTYHLRKRVPTRYQPVEERKSFYVSLGTDSHTLAQQKAPAIWNEQLEYWEASPSCWAPRWALSRVMRAAGSMR